MTRRALAVAAAIAVTTAVLAARPGPAPVATQTPAGDPAATALPRGVVVDTDRALSSMLAARGR